MSRKQTEVCVGPSVHTQWHKDHFSPGDLASLHSWPYFQGNDPQVRFSHRHFVRLLPHGCGWHFYQKSQVGTFCEQQGLHSQWVPLHTLCTPLLFALSISNGQRGDPFYPESPRNFAPNSITWQFLPPKLTFCGENCLTVTQKVKIFLDTICKWRFF
jgi:hypothetical protein